MATDEEGAESEAAGGLLGFCRSIEERLRPHGVAGLPELVDSFERVRGAFGALPPDELDRALVDVGELMDRLRLLSGRLTALGEMKRILLGMDLEPSRRDGPLGSEAD